MADYDSVNKLVYLENRYYFYSYNYDTNTYTKLSSISRNGPLSMNVNGIIDPVRRKFFFIGGKGMDNSPNGLLSIDLSAGSNYQPQNLTSQITGCDALLAAQAPGLAYDATHNVIVGWPNFGNTVYIFNPDTNSCTTQTYAGGPPDSAHKTTLPPSTTGTYGRFRYFPSLNAFAVVNDWNIDAFMLTLDYSASSADTTPPTVSITAPASGSTVSGTVNITANAADNVAVASVQYTLDGVSLGSAMTSAPYSYSWNTTAVSNGSHLLTAVATDTSKNSATSSSVTVNISNTTAVPPSGPTAFDAGFNFRATAPYVTNGTNEVAVLGDVYPHTENGITYGWNAPMSLRDRNSAIDHRLAGVNFSNGNIGQKFRVDLPAPGTYQIHLAMGDYSFSPSEEGWRVWDGSTLLDTVSPVAVPISNWRDATGLTYSASAWPQSEAARTYTFTGTTFYLELLGTASPDPISYLRITSAGTTSSPPPADTTSPTVPSGVTATALSGSQISLSWTAATDNVGVTGYKIYRGGAQIGATATTAYQDSALSPSTTYTYTVSAYDAAGNQSAQSASASATTQPPTPVSGTGPYLAFSDLDSGPNTGNTDTSLGQSSGVNGVIVSVWGTNLGSSQGGSHIYVNGVEAAKVYYWGNAVPPYSPANLYNPYMKLQEVIFQLAGATPAGSGQISVNVNGTASNGIPFTVRPGNIYFIKTTGSDTAGNGSWSAPWATINYAVHHITVGGTIYVGDKVNQTTADTSDGIYFAAVDLDFDGASGSPNAIVTYPGATSDIGSNSLTNGFSRYNRNDSATDPYYHARYWTISKFNIWAMTTPVELSLNFRLVGNWITAPNGSGATGGIIGHEDNISAFGNEITGVGNVSSSSLYHVFYLSGPRSNSLPQLPDRSNRELAWNYLHDNLANRGLHIYSQDMYSSRLPINKIHHNVVVNQRGPGISLGSYTEKSNWIYDNLLVNTGQGPQTPDGGVTFTCMDIRATDGTSDPSNIVYIYNNTIYGCGMPGTATNIGALSFIRLADYTLEFKNNIIDSVYGYKERSEDTPSSNASLISNNLWYGSGALPAWDSTSLNTDPIFVNPSSNDFHLQSSSPAVDAGVSAATIGAVNDLDGNLQGQGAAYDLGAYEYGSGYVASTSDTTPPSVPTNLAATAISSSTINLSWTASVDNVGVTGYTIYRNGVQIGTSSTASFSDTGLAPSTSYSYTVSARDAAGNSSGQSMSASATTP